VYGYFADGGGGILGVGNLTLTNSTVSDNSVDGEYHDGGGGIRVLGDLTLTNSTVSNNFAIDGYGRGGIGGGIDHWGGNLTLINSTVSGNRGDYGGGIHSNGSTTLTNSTVSGNTQRSSYYPGAIFGTGSFTLINSTVSNNGGGIAANPSAVVVVDTIVADNSIFGTNCSSSININSLGYNLTDDDSCGFTAPGDLVVVDAMLDSLADNGGFTETHALLVGGPAIDAGSPACPPPATDQRGVSRPQGADCDIGAVEYLPEPSRWLALVAGAAFLGVLYRRHRHSVKR
jgi:hypothetical protein